MIQVTRVANWQNPEHPTVAELAEFYPDILTTQDLPLLLDTDSYKLSHPESFPDLEEATAYLAFRGPLDSDERIVVAGVRDVYETILRRRVTWADIAQADAYLAVHSAGGLQFNYPRDLWIRVVTELNGRIPLRVRALRDGETIYPQVPVLSVRARKPYARLVTWFETQLLRIWSPTTTATKSAHIREYLRHKFEASVDEDQMWRLDYALHDFGSRGASSAQTARTAGAAHLIVFDGTDNINAALLATRWNGGKPIGQSVIASEHSVMTAWDDEDAALDRLVEITPVGGVLSCVADTYDYNNFIWNVVPRHVAAIRAKNIHFVCRPDSGDPVISVIDGLRAMDAAFGHTINSKGFKVITGAAVLQGDGIDYGRLQTIADAVETGGWSAQCVVPYGMGGGLLQAQTRDTLKTAMKLCEIVRADGTRLPIMKVPKTDIKKMSLPGDTQVCLSHGIPKIYPATTTWAENGHAGLDMLETIWDCGEVGYEFESFDDVRRRFLSTWASRPSRAKVLSPEMEKKIAETVAERRAR